MSARYEQLMKELKEDLNKPPHLIGEAMYLWFGDRRSEKPFRACPEAIAEIFQLIRGGRADHEENNWFVTLVESADLTKEILSTVKFNESYIPIQVMGQEDQPNKTLLLVCVEVWDGGRFLGCPRELVGKSLLLHIAR